MSTVCLDHLEYHSSRSYICNKHKLSHVYFSNIQLSTVMRKWSKKMLYLVMTNHILLSKNHPWTILLFKASMYNTEKSNSIHKIRIGLFNVPFLGIEYIAVVRCFITKIKYSYMFVTCIISPDA